MEMWVRNVLKILNGSLWRKIWHRWRNNQPTQRLEIPRLGPKGDPIGIKMENKASYYGENLGSCRQIVDKYKASKFWKSGLKKLIEYFKSLYIVRLSNVCWVRRVFVDVEPRGCVHDPRLHPGLPHPRVHLR